MARVELPREELRCLLQNIVRFLQVTNLALERLDLNQFTTSKARTLPRIDLRLQRPPWQQLTTNPQFRGYRLTGRIHRWVFI